MNIFSAQLVFLCLGLICPANTPIIPKCALYIFRVVCVIVIELALKSWYHPRIVLHVRRKLPDYKFYYWTVLKCWKLKFTNKKVCDKKRVTWNWKFSRVQNPDIYLWRLLWGRRPLLQVAGTFQISCEETQSLRNFEQMVTANDWHFLWRKSASPFLG